MYFCKLKIQIIRIMSSQNNVLKLILESERTVFQIQSMVLLTGISDGVRLTKMLNYYVKKGEILNPRRGIYTKRIFNVEELACSIFHPSYLSLWLGGEGIVQKDNVCIASAERAFLDMVYLSAGNCYFDNLRPLDKKIIKALIPSYRSKSLEQHTKRILNI